MTNQEKMIRPAHDKMMRPKRDKKKKVGIKRTQKVIK